MIARGEIRIGCSGWIYPHWRGRFYPADLPQRCWFDHYARHFDTVEINNSFYRLPKLETFAKWRDLAPEGFRYAVKANRFLTQAKKLKDCAEPLERNLTPVRALGDALGPVLYQLPPRFRANLERLESFLMLLPRDMTHVFEFREQSWMDPTVLALLERYGAGFCTHDMPGLDVPRWTSGTVAYVRFHGAAGKYHGRYGQPALQDWAEWMEAQARTGRTVWAYFNNDVEGQAIEDALVLKRLLGLGE
ncbi:DUF72 domain-containing protein [Sphingomonas sp. ID0503]|uniref:DUF72 domain-containing protein n=1 Tax=Sphingomonas sp. ID0503 TaxID=3399691 RepID=UPI003AFB0990